MRTFNTHYTTAFEFEHYVRARSIEDGENVLIQIFTSLNDEKAIATLLHDIAALFPNSHIIGSTTDGEICDNKVTTDTTVISITVFEKTKLGWVAPDAEVASVVNLVAAAEAPATYNAVVGLLLPMPTYPVVVTTVNAPVLATFAPMVPFKYPPVICPLDIKLPTVKFPLYVGK